MVWDYYCWALDLAFGGGCDPRRRLFTRRGAALPCCCRLGAAYQARRWPTMPDGGVLGTFKLTEKQVEGDRPGELLGKRYLW